MKTEYFISINEFIENRLANGKYSFSLESLNDQLPNHSKIALRSALNRLIIKGKVISFSRGFYLIISAPYLKKGILPITLFLDDFMKYLQRPYYVALLNAAAFHGSSHQQPQEYFVMTTYPVMRTSQKNGLKINYISTVEIPDSLIDIKKTEAGYLNISNPVLTACDLIHFEKRVGGMNRVSTVIYGLSENIKPTDFNSVLFDYVPISTLQRLGFILENVCQSQELSNTLFEKMEDNNLHFYRTPLKADKATKGYQSLNRWKVILNTDIEIDE